MIDAHKHRTPRAFDSPTAIHKLKEVRMAAVRYTKGDWVAQADIQERGDGKFQGIVLLSQEHDASGRQAEHTVDAPADSPAEALEEAKALAHRLLAGLDG
jgi:hypothetical protein